MRRFIHPAVLMISFWLLIFLTYFLAPVILTPAPTLGGVMFLTAHILLFVLGSLFYTHLLPGKSNSPHLSTVDSSISRRLQRRINTVLLIGMLGGLVSIYSKFAELTEFSLASIYSLRLLRAQSLLGVEEVHSSLASAGAFLCYPAGFVGLVSGILYYENMSRITKLLMIGFVFTILGVAILAGGRSPILVLLLFTGIAFYTRKYLGKSFLPKSLSIRYGIAVLFVAFVAYSSILWTVRSQKTGLDTAAFMSHAARVWGVEPTEGLIEISKSLNKPELPQAVVSSVFYFIQNLSMIERLLDSMHDIKFLYGGYHIDILAAALRAAPGGDDFLKPGYQILLNANIYGFFVGAWGALFIDLGYFSFLAALIWGVVAGRSWRNFYRNPNLLTALSYVFWSYSIFISFVSPPFGFSNSFAIYLWFVLFLIWSKIRLPINYGQSINRPDMSNQCAA
ncbi:MULTISPECIES: oligosaccharide repeat unit polymerase [unclassified Legionella]|uniref:oligosaccharide repeat unit polymerase n=1 Tax=unclassified Legionella TaxID=2622702 RepID=UPI001E2AE217|nr:oligosaccharide repeat unit polymerase [Legionella sp. 31fI33]MCC5014707.1 oligosaccharide repeat unit polymerase [Legionella sp. 31fI33]